MSCWGPRSRELFRRVAVFGGSFSMKAAEAVCDANVDGLESLVIKSLVRRLGNGRFSMLETVPRVRARATRGVTIVAGNSPATRRVFLARRRKRESQCGEDADG